MRQCSSMFDKEKMMTNAVQGRASIFWNYNDQIHSRRGQLIRNNFFFYLNAFKLK